jgi:hypothetical protein
VIAFAQIRSRRSVSPAAGLRRGDAGRGLLLSTRPGQPARLCKRVNATGRTSPRVIAGSSHVAERGALGLDDQVVRWFRAFPAGRGRVTVRHVLSHSAGLSNPIPVGWVRLADEPARELGEFATRLMTKHSRLRGEPAPARAIPTSATLCSVR